MKKLILIISALGLFSCGKIHDLHVAATEVIPEKMEKLAQNTNELKRLSILAEEMNQLENEKNHQVMSPIPVDLMKPGAKFAENVTATEVSKWAYLIFTNINKIKYDDNSSFITIPKLSSPEKFRNNKVVLFNIVAVVAAFLPDSTVDELLLKLKNRDRFSMTILSILALRADMLDRVILTESLLSEKADNVGVIEEAIKYTKQIDFLLRLPYANKITVKTIGFDKEDENAAFTFGLNMDSAKKNWIKIQQATSNIEISSYALNSSEAASDIQNQNARFSAALDVVAGYLKAWGVDPLTVQ
jgi:hypothetical protein